MNFLRSTLLYALSLCLVLQVYYDLSCWQVELESVRTEYANAQLECNAADERANLLASEVIGLEDKVLSFLGMFCLQLSA